MNHPAIADVQPDMQAAAVLEALEQQVSGLGIVECDALAGLALRAGVARGQQPGFAVRVLDQTTAIESGGITAAVAIRPTELPQRAFDDLLTERRVIDDRGAAARGEQQQDPQQRDPDHADRGQPPCSLSR
jgi:hypothetical protein